MKKTVITLGVFSLAILFTLVVYYEDVRNTEQQKARNLAATIVLLENKLMRQIDAIQIKLPDTVTVHNVKKQQLNLSELTSKGARIGLYIDRYQCETCWQSELASFASVAKKMKGCPEPFVLASNYNIREIKMLNNRKNTDIPIFVIGEFPQMEHLEKYRLPFFFVLEPEGIISSVYFPDEESTLGDSLYFDTMIRKCKQTVNNTKAAKKSEKENLELLNAKVDIGDISMRKKKEVTFKIKNNGTNKCQIYDVLLSCSCLMLKASPKIILPGEIGELRVDFLSSSKGKFSRLIQFSTDRSNEPYTLMLKGTVI